MRLLYSLIFSVFFTTSLFSLDCIPDDGYIFVLIDTYDVPLTGCQESTHTNNEVCNEYPSHSYSTTYSDFVYDPSPFNPADRYTCTRTVEVYNQVTCKEIYPPDDLFSIKSYSGPNKSSQCEEDMKQFPSTDSMCYMPKCSTDPDVTLYVTSDFATWESDHDGDGTPNKCDPEYPAFEDLDCDGDGVPNSSDPDTDGDGIPNETDSDDTASGGGTSEPTPEEQAQQECEAQKQTFKDYGYWIAVHSTLEIGYTNEYNFGYARKIAEYPDCDFDVFEVISCPKMYKYDLNQDKCVKADDSKSSDENCASTYVKTDFLDFSNVGYDYRMNEPYNLESFKCYIEYSCSIDYKIKKFDEVSCTSDTTDMSNVVEMEIKPSETNSSEMTADFTSSSSGLTLEQKSFNELKKVNSNLERMIDSINNMDTLASAVDGGSKVSTMDFDSDTNPSYNGNSVADLEQSLSDFGSLGDDFTKFGDNLMNDISTVGESFSNAENLFINGNLALTHITEPVTCPHTLQHEGFTYEVDLCETVSPYSNVIYTFIYMLGFFSILITFSYIFVLKGVD